MRRLQTGKDGVRQLVYNGDTDPSITSIISQNLTYALGFPVKEPWRSWSFGFNSSVVAGQVAQWEGNVTLVTIRGAGQ